MKKKCQFHMEVHKSRSAKTILNNKSFPEGLSIPGLNLYYEAILIKTAQYWNK